MDVFVQAGLRQHESRNGLEHLGVPRDNQLYLGMPDGRLAEQGNVLADEIVLAVRGLNITHLHTLGRRGFDCHRDHIATHEAALLAAKQLAVADTPTVLALNAEHQGAMGVSGDPFLKLGAMACHISQFALHDKQFWQDFKPYTPLIWQQETYDVQIV